MSTLSSIRAQVISELLTINDVTDMDDETLHDAIQSLIDGYGASDIDVSGIVSYYQTAVRDAMEYVRKLGPKWVNNLVVTDTHYEARSCRNSAPILALMYSTGKFDKIIHMGDCIDLSTSATDYAAFAEDFSPFNGKMLLAIGNHDPASNATVSPTREDYYNDFLSDMQGLGGTPENFNYYYDNTEKKIRYIVHMYSPSQDNANFVGNAITSLPAGWTYVVVNHYPQELNSRTVTAHRLADTMNKRFGFFIDGHRHKDMLWTTNRIPEITMMSDCLTYPTSEDADLRVKDTDTEHAITILSIKPSTGEVKTYRIGAVYDNTLIPKTFQLSGENPAWVANTFLNGQGGVDYVEDATKSVYGELLPLNGSGDELYVYTTDGSTVGTVYLTSFSEKRVDAFLGRPSAPNNAGFVTPFNNITRIAPNNDSAAFGLVGIVTATNTEKIKISKEIAEDMPVGSYEDLTSGWSSGYVQAPGDVIAGSDSYQYHPVIAVEPNTTYRIANDSYSDSGFARVGFQSKPARGFGIEQKSPRFSDGYWEFTTPATAHFALISLPIADSTINRTVMYLAEDEQPVIPEETYTIAEIEQMGYVIPTGTKNVSISENGTTIENVSGYANAQISVNVSGGSAPSGSIEITENGTYDVTDKASAIVNVSGSGVSLPTNMAMGTYVATGTETYLVAQTSKLGDILGGAFFMDDLETLPTTGTAYTVNGVVNLKLDYTTKDSYRATYVKADGTNASYSIANSRLSAGKLEFYINPSQPLKAGATYTWVLYGKTATT